MSDQILNVAGDSSQPALDGQYDVPVTEGKLSRFVFQLKTCFSNKKNTD